MVQFEPNDKINTRKRIQNNQPNIGNKNEKLNKQDLTTDDIL